MPYDGSVKPALTELKAQAIALMVLGYSCRDVEHELRRQFPLLRIPHYTTIARWLQKMAGPQSRGAAAYWLVIAHLAAEEVGRRIDAEGKQMSLMEQVEFASRVTDIYFSLRERAIAVGE